MRDARDGGAFGYAQLAHAFTEKTIGRRPHAIAPLREIDDIHVPLHDLLLGASVFQVVGPDHLLQLAVERIIVMPRHVFDQLLGDGRRAESSVAAQKVVDGSLARAQKIHAVMLPESLIFDGDKGIHQRPWQLGIGHGNEMNAAVQRAVRQLHTLAHARRSILEIIIIKV